MGIVNWTDERGKDAAKDIESSSEALMHLLKMSSQQLDNRWKGSLIVEPEESRDRRVRVVLKKQFYRSEMHIEIYDRNIMIGDEPKDIFVNISTVSVAGLTVEELKEMHLAIEEGLAVYRHPAHWIELNKKLGNTELLF